ncbi:MAG: hypothetical protein JWN40_2263 [Phycisphaerales bacterium]|nr:hypothetical protein [Phycisphaerales bacterium]
MRYAIAMFTAAAALFIAIGANVVLDQQHKIDAARPVPGVVSFAEVRENTITDTKNRRTTTYRPIVRYHYSVGDAVFGNDHVFPITQETSARRAKEVVERHKVGTSVTVWYDPIRPSEAFLIRDWDFSPYLLILCAMTFLATGLGFWAAGPWRRRQVWPPKAASGGWHQLTPRANLAAARRPWRATSLAWFAIGGIVAGHYFVHADRPYELLALIAVPLYFILGLIPLVRFFHHRKLARVMRDAIVTVNTDTFWIGKTFNLKFEQRYRKPTQIELLRIGLICEKLDRQKSPRGKAITTRSEQFETWEEAAAHTQASPDHPLQAKTKFTPPKNQPPTTPEEQTGLPRFNWRLVVEIKTPRHPTYRAEYPITVES